MADSQATPTIELQTPPNWAESLAGAPAGMREQIAGAADEARRHAEEGFTTADLRKELKRSKRSRALKRLGIVLGVLVALIAAVAIAVAVLCSVNQVNSDTMAPTLRDGQLVVSSKDASLSRGDVFAYRDGDGVAFGRVAAEPGSWVNIMNDGTLFVTEASLGNSSSGTNQTSNKVKITRQVPPDSYYVLGDAEDATISGLANAEDFVMTDQVIGKTLFKVWPITSFGPVN